MSSQDAAGGGPSATGRKTADELLAAVRAVESGERAADSFFTERAPAPGHRRQAVPPPSSAAARTAPDGRATAAPEDVRALLAEGGAPAALAAPVTEVFGAGAAEVLRADPWRLLSVAGVRPEQADTFARALLGAECGPGDERRVQALVVWLLERAALLGHTALEPDALGAQLARHAVPDPEEAVRGAVDAGTLLVFEDALDALGPSEGRPPARGGENGGGGPVADAGAADGDADGADAERPVRLLVGLDRYALAEESLADGLTRIANGLPSPGSGPADGEAAWPAGAETPAETRRGSAADLVRAAAGHALVAHTGGEAARAEPAALVAAARAGGLRAYAATHTEDGRERLAGLIAAAAPEGPADAAPPEGAPADAAEPAVVPGPPACTVAGLLAGREGPARDTDGAWELDLLVVCDAPQLDVEVAAALVESVPDGARLVLSGDPRVLGSVGPGLVFGDVLAARTCPQVASRTPDPGPIGELVSGVGAGELLQVEAPAKEVVIVPVRDPGDAVHRTVQLVADSVPRAIGIPAGRTLVITPGHGGGAGTRALNSALKTRLNPGPGRFGGFDPGDRVTHTPAPGRTALGTVLSGGQDGLRLELPDRTVVVPPERVESTVRHGWAVTGHQAVGLRPPAAVVVLPGDAAGSLTREWVYTAFGRAGRHLSVVHGADEALVKAVSGVTAPARTTRLRTLLVQAARAASGDAAGAPGTA